MSSQLVDAIRKAKKKTAQKLAGPKSSKLGGKPSAASGARKPKRKAQISSSDDDSSADDDEDAEIGLTASENVKATMKPITGDEQPAESSTAAPSKGKKRKAAAAEDADEDDPNALIDVEFGIYDPRPVDYLTLKMLLKDYVPVVAATKKSKKAAAAAAADEEETDFAAVKPADDFALHEMCDAIVDQVAVGSMVKGEGTEEPLGFYTALNLAYQEENGRSQDGKPVKWVTQLRKHILKHAPAESKSVFESALSDQNTGLLVQGRLLNVPPQIIPALHGALLEDMSWAQANRAAYGAQFKFKQYVLIGRMFKPPPGSKKALRHDIEPPTQFISPFASKKKQKKAAAAAAAAVSSPADADLPEWDWVRFEEELYARDATAKFTFAAPFTAEDAAAGRLPQNCVVMIVPHNKVVAIAQELAAMAAIV